MLEYIVYYTGTARIANVPTISKCFNNNNEANTLMMKPYIMQYTTGVHIGGIKVFSIVKIDTDTEKEVFGIQIPHLMSITLKPDILILVEYNRTTEIAN